jgi:hypothetical protein
MGTSLKWILLMSVVCLLRLPREGEAVKRVVVELEFECLPQKSSGGSLTPGLFKKPKAPDCHARISYYVGTGTVQSVWPKHVSVGYFWAVRPGNDTNAYFNYTVKCEKDELLQHQGSSADVSVKRHEHFMEGTIKVDSQSERFPMHSRFECKSDKNHRSTIGDSSLELQCGAMNENPNKLTTAYWSSHSHGPVPSCQDVNNTCVHRTHHKTQHGDLVSNNLKTSLLSSLPKEFQCIEQFLGSEIGRHNFTVQYDLKLPTSPAPLTAIVSTLPFSHGTLSKAATEKPTGPIAFESVNTASKSVTTASNIVMALSASAAGATALVVIVLLIMCYRHHRKEGNETSTSTVQIAASLFRLPRRLRSRSNNYVGGGQGDRLLSEMEESTLPRAMKRYGTSSLHYSDQWEINRATVTQLATAGEGCYSQVLQCQLAPSEDSITPFQVAVKTAKRPSDKTALQELVTEALAMRRVGSDQNIIKLLGVCTRGGPLWLVMEYAPFGNLRHYLRSRRPDNDDPLGVVSVPPGSDAIIMTEDRLLRYSRQIANGMKYLISKECLHCNLCARSVLVFDNETLKLSNFGVVKERDYATYYNETAPALATVKWQAPETFLRQEQSEYSDVWSFGILMWEVATLGGTPYPGVAVESLQDLIIYSTYRMQRPRNCSRRVYSVMTSCWASSPHQRPKFVILAIKLGRLLSDIESESVQASAVRVENEANGESSGQAG